MAVPEGIEKLVGQNDECLPAILIAGNPIIPRRFSHFAGRKS